MNPQVYQSLKLMEMPSIDLRERIGEELERNPALEVLEDRSTVSLSEYTKLPRQAGEKASEEHRRFIEGALTHSETLQEHLLWQLQLEPVDDELRAMAEILIQNLDEDGFHKEQPQTLFREGQSLARLQEAMDLVRSLDPAGTCTADYLESLKVQISLMPDVPVGIENAPDHLDLLEKGKFTELARIIKCNEKDIRAFYERFKELSPFPGRSITSAPPRYVIPDVQVIKDEDDFVIIHNDESIPVLGISPIFRKLNKQHDQASQEFVKENVREAQSFIQQLQRRRATLLRVVNALLQFQRPFFLNGPKYLTPLTLGDIAQELKLHETTISRTANGKYIQTEWGIFEIRYFFTNSISGTGSGGSQFSKGGVKAIIQEIIAAENRRLSDQDISELLEKRGISLARRTVAKYRKELDMGSSYSRKTISPK